MDTEAGFKRLREAFPDSAVGKLPRCTAPRNERASLTKGRCNICKGWHETTKVIHLDYVGHAAVTDRLLEVDPTWSWEPFATDETGLPRIAPQPDGSLALWIRLTILGVTRVGVGTADKDTTDPYKQLIGDAIRNAAMRFGVALDLWSKEDLHAEGSEDEPTPIRTAPSRNTPSARPAPRGEPAPAGQVAREAVKPPAAAGPPVSAETASEDQIGEIFHLLATLNDPAIEESVKTSMRNGLGHDDFDRLPASSAVKIIGHLKDKLAARQQQSA